MFLLLNYRKICLFNKRRRRLPLYWTTRSNFHTYMLPSSVCHASFCMGSIFSNSRIACDFFFFSSRSIIFAYGIIRPPSATLTGRVAGNSVAMTRWLVMACMAASPPPLLLRMWAKRTGNLMTVVGAWPLTPSRPSTPTEVTLTDSLLVNGLNILDPRTGSVKL